MPNKIAKLYDAVTSAGAYSGEIGGPRNVETFYFAAAVSDGEVVVSDIDTTTGVVYGIGAGGIKAAATADLGSVIGIADEAIAAGTWGRVVTYGVKLAVPSTGTIAAGAPVMTSAGTAGYVIIIGTGKNRIGHTISAASGNLVNVFVKVR